MTPVSRAVNGRNRVDARVDWPDQLFDVLKRAEVRQVGYVPDAGHARLIERCKADNDIVDQRGAHPAFRNAVYDDR